MSAELITTSGGLPETVDVIRILNPFDPREHVREQLSWSPIKTLNDYFPLGAVQTIVSVNGRIVPQERFGETYLSPYDNLVMCPVPQGGGDDKGILGMIAMIAITVFAPQIALSLNSTLGLGLQAGSIGMSLLTAGVSFAGSMLVGAIFAPSKPKVDSNATKDVTSYGVDGAKNTAIEGIQVPVLYGQFRVGGNLINYYVENDGDTQILYARVVVSEGDIEAIESIEFNDQPIANFSDVEIDIRKGTSDQTVMNWFADTISPVSIGTELTETYTLHTTASVDRFRVDIVAPNGLFRAENNGTLTEITVPLLIEYREAGSGGAWIPLVVDDIAVGTRLANCVITDSFTYNPGGGPEAEGSYTKTGTTYAWTWGEANTFGSAAEYQAQNNGATITDAVLLEYLNANIVVTSPTAGTCEVPIHMTSTALSDAKRTAVRKSFTSTTLARDTYELRIKRTTAPSVDLQVSDSVFVSDVNAILLEDTAMPYTAMLGIRVKLNEQLTGLPRITTLAKGRLMWVKRLPAGGGEPAGLNWYYEYSTNPAWIVWDMLTMGRYGGGMSASRLDITAFQTFADHCNTNGLTWNGPIDTQMNVWDACQLVLRVGHAQLVGVGTRFTVVIEKADTPVMMFSVANMIEGTFKETWLPQSDRANEIEVTYYDAANAYKQRTIKVYDPAAIAAGRPQRNASVNLFGVVDFDRAYEEGVFQLNLNRLILQTIEFSAPMEAVACSVGDLIYVQHDMPQWGFAGRAAAGSTATVIQLDRPMTTVTGTTYKLLTLHDALRRSYAVTTSIAGNTLSVSGVAATPVFKRLKVDTLCMTKNPRDQNAAVWGKTRATVAVTLYAGPDGANTAHKMCSDATAANTHQISQTTTQTFTAGEVAKVFLVAKKAELNEVFIQFPQTNAFLSASGLKGANFNFDTGVFSLISTGVSTSAVALGNGYWLISIWATTTDSAAGRVIVGLASSTGTSTGRQTLATSLATDGMLIDAIKLKKGADAVFDPDLDARVETCVSLGGNSYAITVDSAETFLVDQAVELWDTDVIEERDVVNTNSTASFLTVTSGFSAAPAQFQQWMFGETAKVKKPFRVRSVAGSHEYRRDIKAVEYNASVYDLSGTPVPTPNYSSLDASSVAHAVIDDIKEELFQSGTVFRSRVTVHFVGAAGEDYSRSAVYVSLNGEEYTTVTEGALNRASVEVPAGTVVVFKVVARNTIGTYASNSTAPTATLTALGKTTPPEDVTGLLVTMTQAGWRVTWDAPVDQDVSATEVRFGASWGASELVFNGLALQCPLRYLTTGSHNVMARHKALGILSVAPDTYNVVVANPNTPTLVAAETSGGSITIKFVNPVVVQPIDRVDFRVGTPANTFDTATPVGSAAMNSTSFTFTVADSGAYRVFWRAVDMGGNVSASVNTDVTINSNNVNGDPVLSPTFLSDGTAVDHVLNTDGSATVSLEWDWPGNEADIDGFVVEVHKSSTELADRDGVTAVSNEFFT